MVWIKSLDNLDLLNMVDDWGLFLIFEFVLIIFYRSFNIDDGMFIV